MTNYQELLTQFTITDFKLRYKNSYLGFVWVVLKPLIMFFITYTVWSALFNNADGTYKMKLLLGLMLMNFLQDGVMVGLTSLLNKAGIILKINFPREVVVLSGTFTSVINFCVNIIVFIIFAFFNPITPSLLGVLLFFLCFLTLYIIILGVSFFMSVIYIRLRDLHNIVDLSLQALFWLSPVVYTLDMLPVDLQKYLLLNPMTHIIVIARKGLIESNLITGNDFITIGIIMLIAIVFVLIGIYFFKKNVTKIAEYY